MMYRFIRAVAVAVVFAVLAVVFASCSAMPKSQVDEKMETQQSRGKTTKNDFFRSLGDIEQDENLYSILKDSDVYSVDVVLYFYNPDTNKLEPEKRTINLQKTDQILNVVISQFLQGPKVKGLKHVISPKVKLQKVERYGNVVGVYLSKEFLESEDIAIARAALVNTILESQEAKYVKIYVEGRELTHNGKDDGQILGLLTKYPNEVEQIRSRELELTSQGDVKYIKREIYFQDHERRFLVPEIRDVPVSQGKYVEAIVGELIKGPVSENEGLYPTIPSGTQLMDVKFVEDADSSKGVELYFSKEFKLSFNKEANSETLMVGSLVYSLTDLPGVDWIRIYYQNENGEYVNTPVVSMGLNRRFDKDSLPFQLGKRIKVYFSDKDAMNLVPEYRIINRDSKDIVNEILNELIEGPSQEGHMAVIPSNISVGDIKAYVSGQTAFVNLPSKFNPSGLGSTGEIMALYAIVNSLTDPVNTDNVRQIQFLVDGKVTNEFGHMSLADPFVRNPELIKE
ncbi:GerMN domain-containing protein [Caldicoprobacter faecalis]|nr:GerMN domain-containing protein [Caldicoprobacter faecalis]